MEETKNGKIYKYINIITNEFYIGNTFRKIEEMQKQHELRSKNNKNKSKLYQSMRRDGIDKFEISIINECGNISEFDIKKVTQFYIKLLKPTLNTRDTYVNEEEREKRHKKSGVKTKEYIRSKRIYCDCGSIYNNINSGKLDHERSMKHQNYLKRINNEVSQEEEIIIIKVEKKVENNNENVEKYKKNNTSIFSQMVNCKCGGMYMDKDEYKILHEKTIIHQKYIEKNPLPTLNFIDE